MAKEMVGETIGDMKERLVVQLKWGEILEVAWDHQQSQGEKCSKSA